MFRSFLVVLLAAVCAGCVARSSGYPIEEPLPPPVYVQLLAINDFHGALEPAAGSNGRIGQIDTGGAEFLATHLAQLEATNPNTLTVAAGDLIGASPLLSGMFHDEPTVEALNVAGLDVSSVGNHEFDEGWAELYRMQHGGCHPVDGCQDKTPFAGAAWEYLSANVYLDQARVDAVALRRSGWQPHGTDAQTLFPSYTIREVGGVRIGFIGLVLQTTPEIVSAEGIVGLTFGREIDAGNAAAAALRREGVSAIVVLMHEGGTPDSADPNGCGVRGPVIDIANGLSNDIDVIVSGHTHRSYVCTIGTKLVTSAESLGRLITDIDLQIDRVTGEVVSKRARNVLVTRDVAKDTRATAVMAQYQPFYGPLANRPIGRVTAPLTRAANTAGESSLGNVVADSYLEAALAVDSKTALALVNPGGIRSDIIGEEADGGGVARAVRYAQAFDALPFGNRVVVRTMTGEAIVKMLEEQFDNPDPGTAKILQISRGFTYAFDRAKPAGQRVDRGSLQIGGRPLNPAERYRVVSNDFVWSGGDAFWTARSATEPVDAGADSDVLIAYLGKHSPVGPGPQNRIQRQ